MSVEAYRRGVFLRRHVCFVLHNPLDELGRHVVRHHCVLVVLHFALGLHGEKSMPM